VTAPCPCAEMLGQRLRLLARHTHRDVFGVSGQPSGLDPLDEESHRLHEVDDSPVHVGRKLIRERVRDEGRDLVGICSPHRLLSNDVLGSLTAQALQGLGQGSVGRCQVAVVKELITKRLNVIAKRRMTRLAGAMAHRRPTSRHWFAEEDYGPLVRPAYLGALRLDPDG
jgi:hypothetical protein